MPTNEQRADWARIACASYASQTRCHPDEDAPGDLLSDILHLIRANGDDPAAALVNAWACFRGEEIEPEGLGPEPAVCLTENGAKVAQHWGHDAERFGKPA